MQIPLYKTILVGDPSVGKTSLINYYCKPRTAILQSMPEGIIYQIKQVNLPEGSAKISIWDMTKPIRLLKQREIFYRGAHTGALVYDVTRPETLDSLDKWHLDLRSICPDIPLVVVGNKFDSGASMDQTRGMEFALSIRANFLLTSTVNGDGVAFLFERLALNSMHLTGYC